MSAPLPYNITVDFSEEETAQTSGRSTVRTPALDQELANIALSIASSVTRSTAIQRDDNELRDGVVHSWALGSDVLSLISAAGWVIRGAWLTATAYVQRDFVINGTGTYVCLVNHTSGVFATDLAAGKWATVYDSSVLSASSILFTPTGTVAAATVQTAIAEVALEAMQKSANLSDAANLASARSNLSVPSIEQVQTSALNRATIGGTADAMTATLSPARPDLLTDFLIMAAAIGATSSSVPTLDLDGLGAKVIKKHNLQPLGVADVPGAGHEMVLYWSVTNDCFLLLNPFVQQLTSRERVGIKLGLSQLAR